MPVALGDEAQFVVRAVGTALGLQSPAVPAVPPAFNCEAAEAFARQNRWTNLLRPALESGAVPAPDEFKRRISAYQRQVTALNTRCLMTARTVCSLLEEAGVRAAVIKGPIGQQGAYGGFYAKPAGDVDVLVGRRDFERSRQLLLGSHWTLDPRCDSPWWRVFLGEQHLLAASSRFSTVDLHHRIQQPGCPAPRDPRRFLQNLDHVAVGTVEVPTLNRTNAALLACISIVKAMTHREPAGGYVSDLAAHVRRMEAAGFDAFLDEAEAQGLLRTACFALRTVDVVFRPDRRRAGKERLVLGEVPDNRLAALALTPDSPELAWPRRRRILRELSDGALPHARELAWVLASETMRVIAHEPAEGEKRAESPHALEEQLRPAPDSTLA